MMKSVRINVGFVGIVRRKGDYNRILTAGKHWVRIGDQVTTHAKESLYDISSSTEIMLRDPNFKDRVEVIEVADFEIALKYNGVNFEKVVLPGRYFTLRVW